MSRAFSRDDDELAALYGQKPVIQVHNKIDLDRKLKLPANFPRKESVEVSSVRGDGIEELKDRIERIAWSGHVGSTRLDIAINERHADAIRRASDFLDMRN